MAARRTAVLTRTLLACALLGALTACGGGSQSSNLPVGSEPVKLDPADFTIEIDNPNWPMKPGSRWLLRETYPDGRKQRVEITVTHRTKTVAGIETRVIHDVVSEKGKLVEDTFDWYAQDSSGNLWYLGESTKEYEDGKVKSTKGSWEAGVDGAQAGILIPAEPKPGLTYRQEYYKGEAEDAARVLSTDELVEVPYGFFKSVLMTNDYTPLEPRLLEHKFYAGGVGLVLAVEISGGAKRVELLRFERSS
jgi:hypothetical protein